MCEDEQMIQLHDWTKNEDSASEMRDLTELFVLGSEFHAVKRRLPVTPTSFKSTTFLPGLKNFWD